MVSFSLYPQGESTGHISYHWDTRNGRPGAGMPQEAVLRRSHEAGGGRRESSCSFPTAMVRRMVVYMGVV